LKRALEEKQMGIWNIHRQKQYYYLSVPVKFIPLVVENLSAYVVPSFMYKINLRTVTPSFQEGDDMICTP